VIQWHNQIAAFVFVSFKSIITASQIENLFFEALAATMAR
jgi:hypothetical protein